MGYIQNSDEIVRNTYDQLDKILQSQTTMYIQGLGDPVLVTWWNMNDSISTADNGTGTIDAIIGKDSPNRYNKVEGLPAYNITKGLQEIEMALDDNGIMDMNVEIEAVILPKTIIPGPYDHMEYTFASGRSVLFRANDVKVSTVRSNTIYRVPMHLVDIDSSDYSVGLAENTVKTLRILPDNIGTNDRCIVSDVVYDIIDQLDEVIRNTMSNYVDAFFIRRYNSFAIRGYDGSNFNVYDPYLTKFIIKSGLLDIYDELLQPVTMEQTNNFRAEYNKTLFRAVEMRDKGKIKVISYDLGAFSKKLTNPFDYYGEEVFYYLSIYKDKDIKYPRKIYMDYDFLYKLDIVTSQINYSIIETIITRYFNSEFTKEFLQRDDFEFLDDLLDIEYTDFFFYMVPIVLYILVEYKRFLINECI